MTHSILEQACQFLSACELLFGHLSVPAKSKYFTRKTLISSLLENHLVIFHEYNFQALVSQLEDQGTVFTKLNNNESKPTVPVALSMLRILIGFASNLHIEQDQGRQQCYIRLDTALLNAIALRDRKAQIVWIEMQNCVVIKQASQALTAHQLR